MFLRTLAVVVFAVLTLFVAAGPVAGQVAALPSAQLADEWLLVGREELVTLEIRQVAPDGKIEGNHLAREETSGVVDSHPIKGQISGREVRITLPGTGHPGYELVWASLDRLAGTLAGFPDEHRTFLRRLPFGDPA